ncbi:ribosomal protein S18-alanine N-acetyltransferase [Hafnia paralvei]|uniref:ribosomal protein S18-alanine N-acetyltransferase n=1 Tax=Hafnia paralvei TaxID=546367 RepID=UPI0027BA12F8|nr:ribosomal protein S18-alanine N-acetyltransferase [Hafnia paralvei]
MMNNISSLKGEISPLTEADFNAAFEIERASHAFPWTEKTFLSNHGERYYNLKLECDGVLAAFAITQVVLDEATLFNIAVAPTQQRKGLGRGLLEALISDLEEKGIVTLWLEVRDSNRAAIALYESLGFNEVSVRRHYYPAADGREDARIMALPLG